MGGVDIADQLRSYYNIQLISERVWWPMVFFVLDTMITNSYIIFSNIEGTPVMTHKEFRPQVGWGLILDQFTGPPTPQNRSNSQTHTAERMPGVTQGTALPLARRCGSDCDHLPIHLEKKATCWYSRWKHWGDGSSKSLPRSVWSCRACKQPFCLGNERNCFDDFHSS